MTDQEAVTYGPPQYEAHTPVVRGMPVAARGARGTLQAGNLLDLGAMASANGMTRARLTRLLDEFQEACLNAVLSSASKLLTHNREVTQAQINAIGVRIKNLRRITLAPQPTGWRAALGVTPQVALQDLPEYVSLAEVQLILNEAIAALIVNTEE